MSAAESQQLMMQVMLNVQLAQQDQTRRNKDHNNQTRLRLEQIDIRRVSWESQLAGQTLEQRHLLHVVLTPNDVFAGI